MEGINMNMEGVTAGYVNMEGINTNMEGVTAGYVNTNMSGMTFEQALHQIKIGFPCSRTGWNGKGLWVTAQFPDANSANSKPYLVMHSGDGNRVPWTPSQLDFFTDDWFVQAFSNKAN